MVERTAVAKFPFRGCLSGYVVKWTSTFLFLVFHVIQNFKTLILYLEHVQEFLFNSLFLYILIKHHHLYSSSIWSKTRLFGWLMLNIQGLITFLQFYSRRIRGGFKQILLSTVPATDPHPDCFGFCRRILILIGCTTFHGVQEVLLKTSLLYKTI